MSATSSAEQTEDTSLTQYYSKEFDYILMTYDDYISSEVQSILKLMLSSFECAHSVYDNLKNILPELFNEITFQAHLLTREGGLSDPLKDENDVSQEIVANCLLLFYGRMQFEPDSLNEEELPLVSYLKFDSPYFCCKQQAAWLNIPAQISEAKYSNQSHKALEALNKIQEISESVSETEKGLLNIDKNFTKTAEYYVNQFSIKLNESTETLASSFETLKKNKQREKFTSLGAMIVCGFFISIVVISAVSSSSDMGLKLLAEGKDIPLAWILINGWGFVLMALVVIYFFRIALNNYYAARDEILQLETREALCRFIPAYREFTKSTDCNLDEFAKHIFSPLQSRMNPNPHPLDFVGQIAQVVKAGKSRQRPTEQTNKIL